MKEPRRMIHPEPREAAVSSQHITHSISNYMAEQCRVPKGAVTGQDDNRILQNFHGAGFSADSAPMARRPSPSIRVPADKKPILIDLTEEDSARPNSIPGSRPTESHHIEHDKMPQVYEILKAVPSTHASAELYKKSPTNVGSEIQELSKKGEGRFRSREPRTRSFENKPTREERDSSFSQEPIVAVFKKPAIRRSASPTRGTNNSYSYAAFTIPPRVNEDKQGQRRKRRHTDMDPETRSTCHEHLTHKCNTDDFIAERTHTGMDAMPRIVQIIDQITEIVVNNTSLRFGYVREDLHKAQANILEGTADDLLVMQRESVQFYDEMVGLANEYSSHERKVINALDDLVDAETRVMRGIQDIIQKHDRSCLSSRFPKSICPPVPVEHERVWRRVLRVIVEALQDTVVALLALSMYLQQTWGRFVKTLDPRRRRWHTIASFASASSIYRPGCDHSPQRFHIRTKTSQIGIFDLPSPSNSLTGGLSSGLTRIRTHRSYQMSTLATSASQDQYRLPVDVKPVHYDVTIRTDLEKLEYQGFVKISLDVKTDTSRIVLNSSDLKLGKATIYSDVLKVTQGESTQSFDSAQDRITYVFPTALPAGSKAELRIGFEGKITGGMVGYYKSSYDHGGTTSYYALTQFEPTSARRAFPCWDEPLLKATFAITMISRADTVNLSNMPVISEEGWDTQSSADEALKFLSSFEAKGGKWKISRFQTTPPMSSYIVAFANGPFKYLERTVELPLSKKTIPLRVYTTPDLLHQAQFALDVKADVLPLYEKVFDIGYPLPKLDTLVASDFDAGAMENWGLITGRTTAFLLDPRRADLQAKKNIMKTQSHEVAHMWFGNITTMEWWKYLYLNEGFATLMGEVIIAGRVFPDWKVDSSFISEHLNSALGLDAKPSSHPIEVECPDANHINQIFDALSYSKAASVLRMLANYVGEEQFLKGVSLYLKRHLYGNSVTNDLWKGISEATGLDIVNLMDNWISKIGFPVLTVTENANGIHVRQDRFLETGRAEGKDNETLWNVPLSLLTVGEDGKATINKSIILKDREMTIPLDISKPFKLNAGTSGVYRVLYTPERLEKIAHEAAKDDSCFSFNDRLGLVHDAMALSKAGLAKLSSALTLVESFKNEKEYLVWSGISESVSGLISVWWEDPKIVDKLNEFRRGLFVPLVEQLGYEYEEGETADTTLLRTCAITQAALAGDKGVVGELRERFAHYMKTGDDSRIPADLQRITFRTAVKYGGPAEYGEMQKFHDQPKTPTAKIAAIIAMGATEDPKLIKETFDFIMMKSRDQDMMYFFRGLETNFKTRRALAQFFKDEYNALYKRFESNFTLSYLVSIAMSGFSTRQDYDEVAEFFKDKDTSKYNLSLAQVLDSIRARSAYIERSSEDLWEWLGELRQQ
ncbi:hypothetical protein AX17_004382 [Amanita inopinata Kibby_2008]|nr:hypothetical protein AX17_004382 [Amanita inopinata Kibby_2008]